MSDTQPIPDALLEVLEPDGTRRPVRITETPFLIGRGTETGNHLVLADKRVSRQAAAVVWRETGFCLEDRGQRHGVFVNGAKVEECALQDGDVVSLGTAESLQLVFRTGSLRESLPQILSRLEEAPGLEPGARDLRPLGLLLEATALLQSHLPLEELLGAMVERALAITDADRGLLLEKDRELGLRPLVARLRGSRRAAPESIVPAQTAVDDAIRLRRSVVEEDVAQGGGKLAAATSVVEQQLRSIVALPLHSLSALRASDQTMISTGGELLGVLYLDSRRPAAFSRLQRQILDALAREAASVLDNARLLQREQERLRMEQELSIARTIQQALLPRGFRQFPYLQVTGVNRPCQAVGGDYFDVMELSPEQTGLIIADVCGKGLGAALLTTMLQGSFSALAPGQDPAQVFARVNRFICDRSGVERYATLFLGLLDASGLLQFVNAGHPSPYLLRGGKVEAPFAAECLPIGLVPYAEYNVCSMQLNPGDTLILFTDGINEAANLREEQYGLERLEEILRQHATEPLDDLKAAIESSVEDFSHGAYQADDITLLLVRYQGATL